MNHHHNTNHTNHKTASFPILQGFRISDRTAPGPDFPTHCPTCMAMRRGRIPGRIDGIDGYLSAEYACGGRYRERGTIQSRTIMFGGRCGEVAR